MAHNNHNFQLPDHFIELFRNGNFVDPDEDAAIQSNQLNANDDTTVAWVFGYGSLCWFPGFDFSKCITGYIRGYSRRFWQGNTTHRGTEEKPGRVATLIEDKEGITWGCAYKISGNTALEYLKQRECTLGGYATIETKFYPRVASYDTPFSGEAIEVLMYIATPTNVHWLGEDTPQNIATQIVECSGSTGHNVEYLIRLAIFMREEIPDAEDGNLFELEYLVLEELQKRQIPLWSVMGANPERIRRDSHENIRRPPSFEFTSRIVERKLRCLNI
ncbi:glutathione-specific gamma-glutamylcyclotransferase 1-like [Teleopsis dalmanni]|uniref:glutathione-specific gamma-glutamylcyclotransferase 1-like n=1 Tax=Teleopsis dalmanni TaxID=139649 RepID=UPI000D32A7EC|nr:glutathione-specific gamma-glutamylcyclotransferase 1-like [Teleopsis dalmanni]